MRQVNSHINISNVQRMEDNILLEIEQLQADPSANLSWAMLSDYAGYRGATGLKNVVKDRTHSLSAERFALVLLHLSKMNNHRLHRFVLDTTKKRIVDRISGLFAKGNLQDEIYDAMVVLIEADKAVRLKDADSLVWCINKLDLIVAQINAELDTVQSTRLQMEIQ